MFRTNRLTLILLLTLATQWSCKTRNKEASRTAQEQCNASSLYTWSNGECRLNADLQKEQTQQSCLAQGSDFIWINNQCIRKDDVRSPRELCESGPEGSYWRVDPVSNQGACIGPQQSMTPRDECMNEKVPQGYIWQDERCLSPEAQKCQEGGDHWTADNRCITPAEKSCLDRNDGSRWSEGRCISGEEYNCRQRGYHFVWSTEQKVCRGKTFIDYCEDSNIPDADLAHTVNEILDLPGVTRGDCYQAANDLVSLKAISLPGKKIKNLAPLAGLGSLEKLDLQSNDITDISHLEGLSKLTYLNLAANKITDLSVVSNLRGLTELSLSDNQISDLKPIAGLKFLKTLYLTSNKITDISSLLTPEDIQAGGLQRLTTLHLSEHCSLQDISGLTLLVSLSYLVIQNTGVDSKAIPELPANPTINHSKCP